MKVRFLKQFGKFKKGDTVQLGGHLAGALYREGVVTSAPEADPVKVVPAKAKPRKQKGK